MRASLCAVVLILAARASAAPASTALFDPDPAHPYNRARAALFVRAADVTRPGCLRKAGGCPTSGTLSSDFETVHIELGGDEPTLFAGTDWNFLRDPARQQVAIAALAEAARVDPKKTPLAAVLFQADLWERFDALWDSRRFGEPPPDFTALRRAIARTIRAVALPKATLLALPSNVPAIARAYPAALEGWPRAWAEVRSEATGPMDDRFVDQMRHAEVWGHRTVFRTRVEPAEAFARLVPSEGIVVLPPGSRLSLAGSPIAISREGELVALPLVTLLELLRAMPPAAGSRGATPPFEVYEATRRDLLARSWRNGALTRLAADTLVPMGASCSPNLASQSPIGPACVLCHNNPGALNGPLNHGKHRLSIETDDHRAAATVVAEKRRSDSFAALRDAWGP
jgi:hypothetical protein